MARTFPGYSKKALTWLRQIAVHNDRDWFRARKATYEAEVQAPTRALVEALNARLARFAPAFVVDPRRAVHRIHRDLRFGTDKTPYKTYVAATFAREGRRRGEAASFWFAVSARGVEVAGGAYAPRGPQLAALRAALAEDPRGIERLCRRQAVREALGPLQGAMLRRVPRGWPADHPAALLLRRKQLVLRGHLPAAVATTPDLLPQIARRFRLLAPIVAFLDAAMDGNGR